MDSAGTGPPLGHWSRRLAGELATLPESDDPLEPRAGAARHGAGAPLVDRIGQVETPRASSHPGRIELDLRREPAAQRPGPRPARGVPDIAGNHARLVAGRLADQSPVDRPAGSRPGAAGAARAEGHAAPRPILPASHPHRPAEIRRLELAPAVTGKARVGRLSGSADDPLGRALIKLDGALEGGDWLLVNLDAEPDGNRFDIDVRATAPAGLLPAMFGSKRPLQLVIEGDGGWKTWRGRAAMDPRGGRRRGWRWRPTMGAIG